MKLTYLLSIVGVLLGGITASHATNLGFGQLGGNNTAIPRNFGSNAVADGSGYVVSLGGTTPDIFLTWDAHDAVTNHWDIHTSGNFAPLENAFEGGGAWDNEGNIPRIAQLDFGFHTIQFDANPGVRLVLTSFDFGHTAETAGTTEWSLTLTQISNAATVWSQGVTFVNGQVHLIAPNFTGAFGESYLLTFERISQTYGSDGRHGIDNLQFSQVPEPATYGVAFAGLLGLLALRRRKAMRTV